ncbi:DivIVA domain-containing protein [Micromonospora sp. HM134]|uniref:DivIVA domain-containing protein n=1 Tax=Micromonospora sp. HM134 TaxID=2583243 RepID=UPI001198A77A|nr:DivIVA domain-containing protein [Micromonospora sp. HM134]QDY07291.1 DivIVA domain-containing protein [Micromonospora sp. HM134]
MTRDARPDGTLSARLHPLLVRDHQFATAGFGRRGLDPREVRRFLHRLALELASLHQEVTRLTEENTKLKRLLRDRRSAQANRSLW